VDKHSGTLHFETEIGRGTTFVLRLPLTSLEKTARGGGNGAVHLVDSFDAAAPVEVLQA
jgi:hypothetical protein